MPDVPESAEAARTELDQLIAWGEDFNQRQAQVPAMNARAAYLQGWLAAQPEPSAAQNGHAPNRAARRAKGTAKS